jgi:hypothetical protein
MSTVGDHQIISKSSVHKSTILMPIYNIESEIKNKTHDHDKVNIKPVNREVALSRYCLFTTKFDHRIFKSESQRTMKAASLALLALPIQHK